MTIATAIWAIVAIITGILLFGSLSLGSEREDEIKELNKQINKLQLENHDLYNELINLQKNNLALALQISKMKNKSNKE